MHTRTSPLWARRVGVALLALTLIAGAAIAGAPVSDNFNEIKKPSSGTAPTFVSGLAALDGTDSTTWSATTPLATARVIWPNGDPVLEVVVRHSAPGATACVAVGRRARDLTFQGVADVQTSTALAGNHLVYDGTGYYGAPLYYHLGGWAAAELRVYDCSGSTTVDLKPVTQGPAARAAE